MNGVERSPSPDVTLRFMAAPTDVLMQGANGVHGGRVLEWIDKGAYACAVGWSGAYCVTAYVDPLGPRGGGPVTDRLHRPVIDACRQRGAVRGPA